MELSFPDAGGDDAVDADVDGDGYLDATDADEYVFWASQDLLFYDSVALLSGYLVPGEVGTLTCKGFGSHQALSESISAGFFRRPAQVSREGSTCRGGTVSLTNGHTEAGN